MADIDPSGVQIVESATPDQTAGPSTNTGLQLAESLRSAEPAVGDLLQGIGHQLQQRQAAKAQADVMSNSGEAFADAVRDGRIEPTQNPWYIQAYNRDSAAVRAQAETATLVDQSQTWAERNDPKAYQAKLQGELGKIAEKYTGPDSNVGFNLTAVPLAKQAIAANEDYNVTRINQEHTQNVSTLMTTAIQDAAKVNGGALSPAQAQAALKPFVDQWVSTGGTVPQARNMMLQSVIGAAANTGNTSLLDVLQKDFDGHGALADMSGPNGQPVAEDLMRSRYYIERLAGQNPEKKAEAIHAFQMGSQAADAITAKYGFLPLHGKVSKEDMQAVIEAIPGMTPQGEAEAFRQIYEPIHAADQLATSLYTLHSQDPGTELTVAKLYERAGMKGYTPDLENDMQSLIRSGVIDKADADRITEKATSRTNALEAKAESRAQHVDTESRLASRQAAQDFKTHSDEMVGTVINATASVNDKTYLQPQAKAALTTQVHAAGESWLASHKGDYAGAQQAQQDAANRILVQHLAHRQGVAPGAKPQGSANPLGATK